MIKRPFPIFILLIIFTFSSCKKKIVIEKAKTLPEATQIGADTFGCLVNGNIFRENGTFSLPPLLVSVQLDILNLLAQDLDNDQSVILAVRNMKKAGEYTITDNGVVACRIGSDNYNAQAGTIVITKFDREKKILSGLFHFTGKSPTSGKMITVEQGRFDVKIL